jgi:phospholipase D1/2
MVIGPPALDVAKHFIQRYNAIKPWYNFWDVHELYVEDFDFVHTMPDQSVSNLKIQVLRSVDSWSASQPHEASIYNAYLHAIENAEHFVYIENQFFISSQTGIFRKVQNMILSALTDRIYRAYENGEDFHVMIVMPLKPEFPEEWDTQTGSDLRAVSYWTYATIYSGKDSLLNRLKERKIPAQAVHHYFSVNGLRTHGSLNGNLVTEIIYVHSKLMIVHDRLAIIGSANINDRSMFGDRLGSSSDDGGCGLD